MTEKLRPIDFVHFLSPRCSLYPVAALMAMRIKRGSGRYAEYGGLTRSREGKAQPPPRAACLILHA